MAPVVEVVEVVEMAQVGQMKTKSKLLKTNPEPHFVDMRRGIPNISQAETGPGQYLGTTKETTIR